MKIPRKLGRKKLGLLAGLVLAALSFGVLSPSAKAVGPFGPDPNDFSAGHRVHMVVSRTTDVNIPQTWVKLYFNAPSGSVVLEDFHLCTDAAGSTGNFYDTRGSAVNGAAATRYEAFNSTHTINGAGVETEGLGALQRTVNGIASGANNCRSLTTTMNLTGLSFSRDVGKYVAYLRATDLINTTQNAFRAHVTTNGYAVGYDSTIPASQFGMNQVAPISGYADYLLKFAPDCYIPAAGEVAYAHWYDDDNGTAGIQPTPMRFQLRKYSEATGAFLGVEPFIYFHRTSDNSPIPFSASGGWYTPFSGSRVDITAAFRADKGTRYIWYWDNVYYNNTLQFKLPYDSIFYNTGCQRPVANYNLTPSVNAAITDSGGAAVPGNVAQAGDSVRFTYTVRNSGTTVSDPTTCTTYANTYPGYSTGTGTATGPPGPATGCPRTFPAGSNTTLVTETVPITGAMENTTICRSLFVSPVLPAGGTRGDEACIVIAAKPYMRVFGGDVSAGNGMTGSAGTCVNNPQGGIITWNRGASGGYAGGGTQYAAMALRAITDFATAQASSGAAPPSGLAFGNQSPSGSTYGGSLGSVPCITDYYATRPTATAALPANVSSMVSGAYGTTGNLALTGGNVNPGQRIQVYVDGNVYITSNITYAGNWRAGQVPLFELIVKGNIYIDESVTQLDGIYIAQPHNVTTRTDGIIYTCATALGVPVAPTAATFFNTCNQRLTVNGSFVANQVQFLRTRGSLGQSTAAENGTSSAGAEVFNYSPAMWMAQPINNNGPARNYDAITSLPPIL